MSLSGAASRRLAVLRARSRRSILALPQGTQIELRAPVFQQYGDELDFVLTEVCKKGCRLVIVDGKSKHFRTGKAGPIEDQVHGCGG